MRTRLTPNYLDLSGRLHYLKKETDIEDILRFFAYLNRFRGNLHIFSDLVFFVLDYSRQRYIAMTGAVAQVTTYNPMDFLEGGLDFTVDIYHKSDFKVWNAEIFPTSAAILATHPHRIHQNLVFETTYRVRNRRGQFFTAMQKNSFITDPNTNLPLFAYGVVCDVSSLKSDTSMLRRISWYDEKKEVYHPLCNDYFYPDKDLCQLTHREKEILLWMAEGHSTKQIAGRFHLSESTVVNHRKNMLRKTNCKNTAELIAHAIRNKII